MKTLGKETFVRGALFWLAVIFALSGCSWMTDFAVSNNSDAPIKILFTVEKRKPPGAQDSVCEIDSRFKITASPLSRWSRASWEPLPPERYTVDPQNCSAEIEIRSGESVVITYDHMYLEHRRNLGTPGRITSLTIQSKDGEISIKGWEITKYFEKLDNALFVYSYK